MRLDLHGGFAEKGRTSLAVETGGDPGLLDAGGQTSAANTADYYPPISRSEIEALDANLITHGHEDHARALGWLVAQGFTGRVFMTADSRPLVDEMVREYGETEHVRLVQALHVELLPPQGEIDIGPFHVATGRSGHIGGGVWCAMDDGQLRFVYCGDVA